LHADLERDGHLVLGDALDLNDVLFGAQAQRLRLRLDERPLEIEAGDGGAPVFPEPRDHAHGLLLDGEAVRKHDRKDEKQKDAKGNQSRNFHHRSPCAGSDIRMAPFKRGTIA